MDVMQENWYSVEELAEKLKLHQESIRRLIRSGKLKAVKFGRIIRIPESSFLEYIEQNSETAVVAKKRRFSLEGIIKDGQVDDEALDEVTKIWESRELQ
jgi:excisionase family DNA binding protein